MANIQNLTRAGKEINSTEKAQRLGKLGGIKSGEAKKAKKTLKEQFEFAIDIYTKKALNDPNITEEQKAILTDTNILILETMKTALNGKVKHETRLKANDMILDRIHGKPKQAIENSGTIAITGLDFEIKK